MCRRRFHPTQRLGSFANRCLPQLVGVIAMVVFGCDHPDKETPSSRESSPQHEALVLRFNDGQKRFQALIAEVRDEEGFDAAIPELNRVVSDWQNVASAFRELDAPPEEQQIRIREMISSGNRTTEPTSEDMLALISIGSREAEVMAWLEGFVAAGREVGVEMTRLYGPLNDSDGAGGAALRPSSDGSAGGELPPGGHGR